MQQCRGGQFTLAVDTNVQNVLGVEFEIQPGTTVWNDTRSKEQLSRRVSLALVVVKEHAWRSVHLRNDNTLGTIHNEGTLVGHQRDVTKINILFLDVLDRLGTRVLIGFEHDQTQLDLQGSSVV